MYSYGSCGSSVQRLSGGLHGDAEDGPAANPAIDTAAVVADQEPVALARFDEVQVFVPAASHQHHGSGNGSCILGPFVIDRGPLGLGRLLRQRSSADRSCPLG
jgi:hypothetical protein